MPEFGDRFPIQGKQQTICYMHLKSVFGFVLCGEKAWNKYNTEKCQSKNYFLPSINFYGYITLFCVIFEGFSSQVENKISAYRLSDGKVPSAQTCKKASVIQEK